MEGNARPSATILVVEDVAEIRAGMRQLLEMDGYRVLEASNAWEARARAQSERPALILTDFDLPTLEGLRQAVHECAALRGVRIVILSPDEAEQAEDRDITVIADLDELPMLLG
jgi:CheY-like chemotaxis protein